MTSDGYYDPAVLDKLRQADIQRIADLEKSLRWAMESVGSPRTHTGTEYIPGSPIGYRCRFCCNNLVKWDEPIIHADACPWDKANTLLGNRT